MVLKEYGLTETLNHPKPILGYTDTETVKLDFDNTPFRVVKYWALRTMKWFKLEGFLILKSSDKCYHVVFNRSVSWDENVRIMAWVSLLTKHKKLTGWFIFQCIKKGSTLRISPKREKPSPRIVYRYGKQDREICNFLKYRKMMNRFMKKLRLSA